MEFTIENAILTIKKHFQHEAVLVVKALNFLSQSSGIQDTDWIFEILATTDVKTLELMKQFYQEEVRENASLFT